MASVDSGEELEDDDDSPRGNTALLMVSGGRGASKISPSSSSCLILGDWAFVSLSDREAKGGPNKLPDGFGQDEPAPDVGVSPAVVLKNLGAAGVVVGVVDSNIDFCCLDSSGVGASISSSLISALAAPPREKPKLLKTDFPVSEGFSLSLALAGSALNVVPRTNGEAPKLEVPEIPSFFGLEGKAVLLSIDTSCVADAKDPDGLAEPKILPPPAGFAPREANPPLFANPANPPEGEVVALANGLADGVAGLANADWPKAGAAEPADPAVQGEDLNPEPIVVDWPKVGAAGGFPNDGVPNDGAPNFGEPEAAALPNAAAPKAGALVGVVEAAALAQGDEVCPRLVAPPKAGLVAAGPAIAPKELLGFGLAAAEAKLSASKPGYVVPCRMDSL